MFRDVQIHSLTIDATREAANAALAGTLMSSALRCLLPQHPSSLLFKNNKKLEKNCCQKMKDDIAEKDRSWRENSSSSSLCNPADHTPCGSTNTPAECGPLLSQHHLKAHRPVVLHLRATTLWGLRVRLHPTATNATSASAEAAPLLLLADLLGPLIQQGCVAAVTVECTTRQEWDPSESIEEIMPPMTPATELNDENAEEDIASAPLTVAVKPHAATYAERRQLQQRRELQRLLYLQRHYVRSLQGCLIHAPPQLFSLSPPQRFYHHQPKSNTLNVPPLRRNCCLLRSIRLHNSIGCFIRSVLDAKTYSSSSSEEEERVTGSDSNWRDNGEDHTQHLLEEIIIGPSCPHLTTIFGNQYDDSSLNSNNNHQNSNDDNDDVINDRKDDMFFSLPHLHTLHLRSARRLPTAALLCLPISAPNLQDLDLQGAVLIRSVACLGSGRGGGGGVFAGCRYLRRLNVSGCERLSSLRGLEQKPYLEEVHAAGTQIDSLVPLCISYEDNKEQQITKGQQEKKNNHAIDSSSHLGHRESHPPHSFCSRLRVLDIADCPRVRSLSPLQHGPHQSLEFLDASGTSITSVAPLGACTRCRLRELHLVACPLLTSLDGLLRCSSPRASSSKVAAASREKITGNKLKAHSLENNNHQEETSPIATAQEFTTTSTSSASASASGISLEELYLGHTPITSLDSIAPIRHQLRRLLTQGIE